MATATQSIRDIVANSPSASAVLERFDIDLCTHEGEQLQQACATLQLSLDQVLEKLADAEHNERGDTAIDPEKVSLSRLVQHIVRLHHRTVRQDLPRLAQMAQKVAATHGERAPELRRIAELVEELRVDMISHLEREEQVLFPYIAQLDQDARLAFVPPLYCFHTVAQPVFLMVQEHEVAEHTLASLEVLSHDFEPPSWACAAYLAFYGALKTFKNDLSRHVYLENRVLFPRAMALEAAVTRGGEA